MPRTLVIRLCLVLCFSLASKQAIAEPNFWQYYNRGDKFKTLVPLVLMYSDDGMPGRRLVLAIPAEIHSTHNPGLEFSAPRSDDLYGQPKCAQPGKYCSWEKKDIVELIPVDSVISLTRITLFQRHSVTGHRFMEVRAFGVVKSTSFKKSVEVDLEDVSLIHLDSNVDGRTYDLPGPNAEFIEGPKETLSTERRR